MLLADYQNLQVFKVDNQEFSLVGQINQFTSILWGKNFNKLFEVEIDAPAVLENIEILKKENIIWGGTKEACIIDIIKINRDADGKSTMQIKAQTLESLLKRRVIHSTKTYVDKYASTIMYDLVMENFVNDENNVNRNVPWFVCESDEQFGPILSMQKTGGTVYDALVEISARTNNEIGFEVQFLPNEQQIKFVVLNSTNHTSSSQAPVIFSDMSDDIITDELYENIRDTKNVAYIAGEGSGSERTLVEQGEIFSEGFERLELYVDARDLQRNPQEVTVEEYENILRNRGGEKLGELQPVTTYDCNINIKNQFQYGIDYIVGDKITVEDELLSVSVDAQVATLQETVSTNYEAKLTLGNKALTLSEKIKNKYT